MGMRQKPPEEDEEEETDQFDVNARGPGPAQAQWRPGPTNWMTGPPAQAPQAPQLVPPRFCPRHNTSEKRDKTEPRERECQSCHMKLQTSYEQFTFCPACSDLQRRCMICGDVAQNAGTYMP